jgi:hypothetical protein
MDGGGAERKITSPEPYGGSGRVFKQNSNDQLWRSGVRVKSGGDGLRNVVEVVDAALE